MVTASVETLAGLALDGVAVAAGTAAAVIAPVETAADVVTRAVHGGEGAGPWVPAGQEWRDRHWPPLGPIDPAQTQLRVSVRRCVEPGSGRGRRRETVLIIGAAQGDRDRGGTAAGGPCPGGSPANPGRSAPVRG